MKKLIKPSQTELWYDENYKRYKQFSEELCKLLERLLKKENISYQSIDCRVKARDSFLKKCVDKEYTNPQEELMDFSGIRIITYTTADVDKACKMIDGEFIIDEVNSVDKASQMGSNKVGYLSVHKIISLKDSRCDLPEYADYRGMKSEIQVRTLLQHAWAEIEHDKSYKFSGVLPKEIKRRFYLIAGVLEMMDTEFQRLSEEIDAYSEEVQKSTKQGKLDIPIDSISLIEYLKTKLEDKIEPTLNGGDSKIIQELKDFGIEKLSDLDALMTDKITEAINNFDDPIGPNNYLGVLRDIMIIIDAGKYFSKAWKDHWQGVFSSTVDFWEANGVDIAAMPKSIGIDYSKAFVDRNFDEDFDEWYDEEED